MIATILSTKDKVALGGAAFSRHLDWFARGWWGGGGLHRGTKTLTEYTVRHALHEAEMFFRILAQGDSIKTWSNNFVGL